MDRREQEADGRRGAIRVENVGKLYRRHGRRRFAGTLKSALVSSARLGALPAEATIAALTGVSFQIEPGEMVGVIGANGSGKSTLLKLLAGIIRPTEGSVFVRGRLAALLELGAGFHPEISGRENIEISGLLLGLTRREIAARFDEIVRFSGIAEFLDAPVKTYSSGMAVRLGFSVAAHCDPDVLLVDEVLSVGDEAFAHRCLEKFEEFERAGKTILVVSHDLALVVEHCPRVLWLERGRLVADAAAAETVARYREQVASEEGVRRLEAARQAGPGPQRIGSGRATVEGVRLLDAAGRPAGRLRSGERVSLEIAVYAGETLADFVFGVAISSVSGREVFGSNTSADGLTPAEFSGSGRSCSRSSVSI